MPSSSPVNKARIFRRWLLAAVTLCAFATLGAQAPAPRPIPPERAAASRDDALKIYVITMGQGDEVYELFGHNAIWVHDPDMAFDTVYNWGVFDFRTPGFVGRFLLGDMRYLMAGETLDEAIAQYKALNRQMWAQQLNLTGPEKRALVDFVRWNAMPQNREYRYDYYLDNCSTRVRDAIDRVTGGAVRAYLRSVKTDETYRSHSLRLMQGQKLMVSGVEMALGRPTDKPLTADETSFLPVQLMTHLRGVRLDGGTRPLIGEEFVMNQADRPAEATTVPKLWKGMLPVGLLLGALVLVLAMPGGAAKRRALATTIAILGLLFGLVGTIIVLLVTITDHVAAHGNENMFLLNPLWLIIAVAGARLVLRGRSRSTARWVSIGAAALALGSVLIHVVGMSHQPNWDVIALLLPPQLAIAGVLLRRSAAHNNASGLSV